MSLKMIVVKKDGAIQMTYEDATTRVLTDVSMADAILSSAEILDRPLPAAVMSPCKDCAEMATECAICDPVTLCPVCRGNLQHGVYCPVCKAPRR
jgi:hypothetical protein